MNRTLLAIASPRSGKMVSMQKVARTISAARYPTKSIQDIGLSFAAAAQMKKSGALGPEAFGRAPRPRATQRVRWFLSAVAVTAVAAGSLGPLAKCWLRLASANMVSAQAL